MSASPAPSHANDRGLADRELLDRLRRGDAAAFEAIFRTWYAPLVRAADAIVHSTAIAEELVQDVLLALWRRREGLSADGSAQAYLFQATRNRALNHLRHGRIVERTAPLVAGEASRRPPAPSADARVAEDELRAALRAAVDALPPRCREVFELSRVRGLRYAEIASQLGVSVKAVEAQMGKALRTLRVRLGPWLPPGDGL